MPNVTPWESTFSTQTRKKLLLPNGYGENVYGLSKYGYDEPRAGIYQIRHENGRQIITKLRWYWPTNPQTIPQQANRAKLADAVAAYQLLTTEEKMAYHIEAYGKEMSGYNLFIKKYLQSH